MAEVLKFIVSNALKLIRRFSDDFGASGEVQKAKKKFSKFSKFQKDARVALIYNEFEI